MALPEFAPGRFNPTPGLYDQPESPLSLVREGWALLFVLALILAINSGATYFIAETMFAIEPASPAPLYIICLAFALPYLQIPTRRSMFVLAGLAGVTAYFCFTSLWSESEVYKAEKLLTTLTTPIFFIVMGYTAVMAGHIRRLAAALVIFAVVLTIAIRASGHDITYFSETNLTASQISYQRISIIYGTASALLLLWARPNARGVALGLAAILFAIMALQAGGRAGALIPLVAIAIRFRRPLMAPASLIAIAAAAVLVVLFAADFRDWFLNQSMRPDAPLALQRIGYELFLKPSFSADIGRGDLAQMALRVFAEQPVLGAGWSGFPVAAGLPDDLGFYPHNLLLEILAETGLVGLLIVSAWMVRPLLSFFRHPASTVHTLDWELSGALLLIGAFIGMFIGDWGSNAGFFLGFGVINAFIDRAAAAMALREVGATSLAPGPVPLRHRSLRS